MTRILAAAAGAALLVLAAACGEKGRPEPGIQMAISHERESGGGGAAGTGEDASRVPARLVVPPEVEQTYSAIRLTWKNSQTNQEGTLDVPLSGTARIPDSKMDIRADAFLPAFTMSGDAITSKGVEATNPAARITVSEEGKEVFSGWIFTNFPDVHPFQHPRFSLRLAGAVKKQG